MAQQADPGGIDPDREALLGVLARHGVAFVMIGGAAIQSHGLRYDTRDMDVTPDTTPENLAALADALNELDCRLITDPADAGSWVPLPSDYFTEHSLRSASLWNRFGITATPSRDRALRWHGICGTAGARRIRNGPYRLWVEGCQSARRRKVGPSEARHPH